MKIDARQRWFALIGLLTLALTAAAWVRDADKTSTAEVVEAPMRAVRPALAGQAAKPATERVTLEKLRAHGLEANAADPFAPRSWRKAVPRSAPANAVAVVAPPPTAPPLPFVYMGKLLSEETTAVFLIHGERNLIVREGDVIDSTYRVERLADAGLTLTHLPTGIRQILAIGEPQ
jgi:hypothetical protein